MKPGAMVGLVLVTTVAHGCGRVGFESHLPADAATDAAIDTGPSCPAVPERLSDLDCDAYDPPCTAPALCAELALLLHFDDLDPLHDFSGKGNDASCTTCPTFAASGGRFDGAYDFDGTTTQIFVPDAASLAAPSAVTMSVWFLPRSYTSDWAPIVTKFRSSPERSNYRLASNGPEFHVNFQPEGSAGWLNHSTMGNYASGRWYHLVGIIDNAGRVVRLYVDGAIALDTTASADMDVGDGDVYVGYAPNELGIDGLVDEVAIWTRHLDEAEITALYP